MVLQIELLQVYHADGLIIVKHLHIKTNDIGHPGVFKSEQVPAL